MVVAVSPSQPALVAIPVVALPSPEPDRRDVLVAIPSFNEGRFIGSLVHEVVLQLRGDAGDRQIARPLRVGFTQVYGAPGVSACTVLSR